MKNPGRGPQERSCGGAARSLNTALVLECFFSTIIQKRRPSFCIEARARIECRLFSKPKPICRAQPISRFHGRDADREMDGFPWNQQFSVKFREILLVHFLNIFSIPVLLSAFAITFTQIINNYPLKCSLFALCLLTVQSCSSSLITNWTCERATR